MENKSKIRTHKYDQLLGCWIDGAILRNTVERYKRLLELLREVESRSEIIESFESVSDGALKGDFGISEEDNLIDHISALLSKYDLDLILDAGDVLVTRID